MHQTTATTTLVTFFFAVVFLLPLTSSMGSDDTDYSPIFLRSLFPTEMNDEKVLPRERRSKEQDDNDHNGHPDNKVADPDPSEGYHISILASLYS